MKTYCPTCKCDVKYVQLETGDTCYECGRISAPRIVLANELDLGNRVLKLKNKTTSLLGKMKKYNMYFHDLSGEIRRVVWKVIEAAGDKKLPSLAVLIPMILDAAGKQNLKREYIPLKSPSREEARVNLCKKLLNSAGFHVKEDWYKHDPISYWKLQGSPSYLTEDGYVPVYDLPDSDSHVVVNLGY